jgi:hypothetical protein
MGGGSQARHRESCEPVGAFSRAQTTLRLQPDDDGTMATFDYRYVPRGGPIGRFTGPLIDKMLRATFTELLAATEEAAVANRGER